MVSSLIYTSLNNTGIRETVFHEANIKSDWLTLDK